MASHFYFRTPSSTKTTSVTTISPAPEDTKPPSDVSSLKSPPRSQQRTTDSSAPSMRLPSGYTTDHWAWSMSDPSFRANELTSLPWDEFDDAFLFPMMSLKDPSILTAEPDEHEEDFEDHLSSSDDTASLKSSSTTQSNSKSKSPVVRASRPAVPRAQSYAQARPPKAQDDARRANSIIISTIKSVRKARKQQQAQRAHDVYKQRKVSELLSLRRQVADLTQRLTMMMANQCAACQLGLIDYSLGSAGTEAGEKSPETTARMERDRERGAEIEGKIARLTRQAELLAF